MKYTVRLLLYTHQAAANGDFPIYLRITINRKQAYIATGHAIPEKYWDDKQERVKSAHTMANLINPDITARKQAAVKLLVGYQLKGEQVTASQVKRMLATNTDLHNIFQFVDEWSKEVQHKRKEGTMENYRKYLKVLELYHGSRALTFEEMDEAWLGRFETHLRAKVGGNYIFAIWKMLKTFFNAAKKRKVITCYPFDTYENPVYQDAAKDYLSMAELDALEKMLDTTTNDTLKQTLTYFLLGCYSGLRLSDWIQFKYDEHVKDNRLYLRATKNSEWVTMPIVGRLARHLERVKACELKITEQEMNRTLKTVIKGKKLTTHCGRKTFAVTMCAEHGISLEVCAKLMGITVAVCEKNYYSVTPKKIEDEVMSKWQ